MKNPVFDFDKGDFVIDGLGAVQVVEGSPAVAQAVAKALHTERGKYEIYINKEVEELSHKYGADIIDIVIRQGLTSDIVEIELKNAVKEAIIYDPEVKSVDNIVIALYDGAVTADFILTTIYDDTIIIEGVLIGD
jgi:hypothetical protein